MSEPTDLLALYGVLLSLGALNAVTHCPGMCGPLMVAFRFGGASPGWSTGVIRLLGYQLGRGLVYAGFGASAGWLSQTIMGEVRLVGPWFLAVVAVGMALVGVFGLFGTTVGATVGVTAVPRVLQRAVVGWANGRSSVVALGAAMAFLPCGVTAQALLLSAATGSVVHGALLLVLLVVLTTPTLLAAHVLGRSSVGWLGRWREPLRVAPSLVLLLGAGWVGWLAWKTAQHSHAMTCCQ